MRKRDYPKVHRRGVAVMVILVLLCLLVPVAMAQTTWPNCDWYSNCTWGCSASDVEITNAWLGYCDNCTPIEPCAIGTSVDVCICADFYGVNRTQIYTIFVYKRPGSRNFL
ncbi:MAG: hypothetical protein WBB08_10445 [Halobacteriota archaeon]